jgi:hypothetical protein
MMFWFVGLQGLLELQSLDLSMNKITLLNESQFDGHAKLSRLKLDGNELECLTGLRAVKNSLHILEARHNRIQVTDELGFLLELKELQLADNKIGAGISTDRHIDRRSGQQTGNTESVDASAIVVADRNRGEEFSSLQHQQLDRLAMAGLACKEMPSLNVYDLVLLCLAFGFFLLLFVHSFAVGTTQQPQPGGESGCRYASVPYALVGEYGDQGKVLQKFWDTSCTRLQVLWFMSHATCAWGNKKHPGVGPPGGKSQPSPALNPHQAERGTVVLPVLRD